MMKIGRWTTHACMLTCISISPATHAQDEDALLQSTFVDDRHLHDADIISPRPQRPELSTPDNVDTGKPFLEWQHLTDDWGGRRPRLDDLGIVFEADLTFDHSHNFEGGLGRGSATRNLLNFNLTLDTQRLGLWEGGTFFLNFQNIHGPGIGDELGDVQGLDNLDADGRTQISEIWYEQLLLGEQVRIRIGKVDVNSEFAYVDNGGEFLNSSMGFSPTVFVMPSYPDPAFGFTLFIYPSESLYAGIGMIDGSAQEGIATGSRGPSTLFGAPGDLFYIAEAGSTWALNERTLPGRVGVGVWVHDGDFVRFDAGMEDRAVGFYFVLDQMLWRENSEDEEDSQGLAGFMQYGYADANLSSVEHHIGVGATWTGAIPERDDDVLGLGISVARLSDDPAAGFTDDAETAFELFYRLQLTPYIAVKPDLQFIKNPGGAGADDALVGTVRVEISF